MVVRNDSFGSIFYLVQTTPSLQHMPKKAKTTVAVVNSELQVRPESYKPQDMTIASISNVTIKGSGFEYIDSLVRQAREDDYRDKVSSILPMDLLARVCMLDWLKNTNGLHNGSLENFGSLDDSIYDMLDLPQAQTIRTYTTPKKSEHIHKYVESAWGNVVCTCGDRKDEHEVDSYVPFARKQLHHHRCNSQCLHLRRRDMPTTKCSQCNNLYCTCKEILA